MKAGGGLITKEDLAAYRAKERTPIHGTYRGYDVYAPPPPSSGGICLVEMLNILENFDLRKQGRFSPETLHLMIETMRRAYCDRARYLGDPDFVKIPDSPDEQGVRAEAGAGPSTRKQATPQRGPGQGHPAHAARATAPRTSRCIDDDGMAVSNTYTLETQLRLAHRGQGRRLPAQQRDDGLQLVPRRDDARRPHRHGAEPDRARQAHASVADADHRGARTARWCWSPAAPAAARSSTRCCA